jgi:hypothetical protein
MPRSSVEQANRLWIFDQAFGINQPKKEITMNQDAEGYGTREESEHFAYSTLTQKDIAENDIFAEAPEVLARVKAEIGSDEIVQIIEFVGHEEEDDVPEDFIRKFVDGAVQIHGDFENAEIEVGNVTVMTLRGSGHKMVSIQDAGPAMVYLSREALAHLIKAAAE